MKVVTYWFKLPASIRIPFRLQRTYTRLPFGTQTRQKHEDITESVSPVILLSLVLRVGLEPTNLAALGPKPNAVTNFATGAFRKTLPISDRDVY